MQKSLTKLSILSADETFQERLALYKQVIDENIDSYAHALMATTQEQFGAYSYEALSAYVSVLQRGGKRLRGALTMHAYYSFGGKDNQVAIEAARAVEMLQAYILILDDIMDRSPTRRGGPTAHMMLKSYHEAQRLADDSLHFGESIATNAALFACHAAQLTIGELQVKPQIKVDAMNIMNRMMMVTAHGQINDVFNEVVADVNETRIEQVLVWKTAYYSFTNPLQFGAALAGVSGEKLETLAQYSLHAGRSFQIIDDILGTFGNEFDSGKSPIDDIKEGKRTLLIAKTLQAAPKADAYFLQQCLGNQALSMADFQRCQDIIRETGALGAVRTEAENSARQAIDVLQNSMLPKTLVSFLTNLVQYVVIRKS